MLLSQERADEIKGIVDTANLVRTGPILLDLTPQNSGISKTIFERLHDALDIDRLSSWRGSTVDDGTCIYTATHAGMMLIARSSMTFDIVRGYTGSGRMPHVWIEVVSAGQRLVIEVANMWIRPGFVMTADEYGGMYGGMDVHERIPHGILRARAAASGLKPDKHWTDGRKVRRLALKLFKANMQFSNK
ncbi:hypothetical protein ACOI1H_14800 [Loktanella sp. DJP18]|uniref:hypothetical protein n=1 Tax=Loktanella sp. DJP18 TaxID=3409788 RepID=UPI003BB6D3F8